MKNTKRNDIILVLILLVSALLVWLCFSLFSPAGDYVVVNVDGKETARYPISEDKEVRLESENGYNILIIKDGKADVTDASCPDGLCVDFHPISKDGETIVCLPNKTVVSVEAGE
ncbi:MAG: NusG domain II-containing protein [Clostridia bacterium]|nr:NusG domain II-containing protein [Clostridia bacterium]MBR6651415.1 NusG domain II-containing protein [Clostridia bacterium]